MRSIRLLTILLVLLAGAGVAQATVVVRAEVEDLTDKATLIVRGEVIAEKAAWTEDHATIRTLVTIRVADRLKGDAGSTVVVTCPGGQVGEDRVSVSGVPDFEVGREVVVFLWKNRHGDLLPLGMNQGRFRVETDPETGVVMARNSLEGLSVAILPGETRDREAMSRPDVMPLDRLIERIRARRDRPAEDPDEMPSGKEPPAGSETDEPVTPAPEDHEEEPKPVPEKPGVETPPGPDPRVEEPVPAPVPVPEVGEKPAPAPREEVPVNEEADPESKKPSEGSKAKD